MSHPCERALWTSLYPWLGLWFAVLAEVMLVLDTYSYSMLPISPPRRTKSLRSLGGSYAHLLDEMTPTVTSTNHSTFSLRNPLWNNLDFVSGRVKPRPTCSSYPIRSPPPPPPEFHDGAPKVLHAAADFHLTLFMLMVNIRETVTFRQFFGRKSTTKPITPRVAQPTSTLTTQLSLHHVKEGHAKDARRHESVRQLFARNSRAKCSL